MTGMDTNYLPFPARANENRRRGMTRPDTLQARLRGREALHVLGLQTLVAGYDLKRDFFAFIESFESGADDGRVMHEDVLAGPLGDKAEPFFVIEPLYFAASHIQLLTF
jgi:hypothetical protein